MISRAGQKRDPFALSLGGMAAMASVVAPPVVPDNRINNRIDRVFDARGTEPGLCRCT